MWITIEALLCCVLATALAANEPRAKTKDDARGKRTLDYSVSHHHSYPVPNYRSERRISSGLPISQIHQYPLFYPIQKPFTVFKRSGLNAPPPPYAVQMEPVVHYSQRDPLYEARLTDTGNDVKEKDLTKESTYNARLSYSYPPAKHIVERPVYIKEPEPIIEIIIKESNITLPPLPTPPVTPAPRKKEQIQVFYVKYKKNPNAYGKDSIVYDKPIPALTPHVAEETEPSPQPIPHYEALHTATLPPPPSTTLRAIVKPESETYHADKGIHITFGKTVNEQRKRSNANYKPESAPEPSNAHAQPQARQFNPYPSQPLPPNRPRENVPHTQYKADHAQFHNDYRNVPPFKQVPFHRGFSRGPSVSSNSQTSVTRPPPPSFTNPPRPTSSFNNPQSPPRQPVPYQPFDQIRAQAPQIQFPRTHTHFPINSQNQQFNNGFQYNQQLFQNSQRSPDVNLQYNQAQPTFSPPQQHFASQPTNIPQPTQSHVQSLQQLHISQQQPHFSQVSQQSNHNIPQQSHFSLHNFNYNQQTSSPVLQQHQQQQQKQQQQQQQQQQQSFHSSAQQHYFPQQQNQFSFQQNQFSQQIPSQTDSNSELFRSLPKYEQHVSVDVPSQQPHKPAQQQISQHQPTTNHHTNPQLVQQHFNQIQKNAFFTQSTYQTSPKPPSSTTPPTTTSTTTEGRLTEKDLKDLNIQLPDEVPEDLREQLLSSGILRNAQISVLDYDKVGDTSIADLPPDQLANFFSAGGAQLGAASDNVPVVVKKNEESDMEESESSSSEVKVPAPVEMKVVRYDPDSSEGKQIAETYIEDGATQLDPVSLEDQQYSRYLPVKVNGAAFPIPDVPELRGRNITSVVVLAPVDLNVEELPRKVRDVNINKNSRQLAANALKNLIKEPSTENFKDWLDKENKTVAEKQAVILLVTGNSDPNTGEKEIFMYDLTSQTVNKLSGELSSAFVDAAETNSGQDLSPLQASASNVVETRIPYPSDQIEKNLKINPDSSPEASEQFESFVDFSGVPVRGDDALKLSSSSVYSKTASSKLLHS